MHLLVIAMYLLVILPLIALAGTAVFWHRKTKRREEEFQRRIFALIYQTRGSIYNAEALSTHFEKILEAVPFIDRNQLNDIRDGLLKRSTALAAVTCLLFESHFQFISNNPFTNVALQKEDMSLLEGILIARYGEESEKFSRQPDELVWKPVAKILTEIYDKAPADR